MHLPNRLGDITSSPIEVESLHRLATPQSTSGFAAPWRQAFSGLPSNSLSGSESVEVVDLT